MNAKEMTNEVILSVEEAKRGKTSRSIREWAAISKYLVTFIALLLVGIGIYHGFSPDGVTLVGLLVIAGLPWLVPIIKDLKLPGGIEIALREAEEIKQEQTVLSKMQKEQEKQIWTLNFISQHLVSKYQHQHLEQLRIVEQQFIATIGDRTTQFLIEELKDLSAKGLIEDRSPSHGLSIEALENEYWKIFDNQRRKKNIQGRPVDLHEFLKITHEGSQYLDILHRCAKDLSPVIV